MTDDLPKEAPIWPKHHIDLVDEAWRKRLASFEEKSKHLLGEWMYDNEKSEYDILSASVAGYVKFTGDVVSIPDDIKTSEEFINWVRNDDDRQKDS